ncbi:hypothetical protein McpSp1_05010 [Methanocorpusculaceae archaeon Sp1]|nr:hypothetical protein [Methanocorpusculaceae archaeon Sp1]
MNRTNQLGYMSLRISSLIFAVLLMSVLFAPTVAAQSTERTMSEIYFDRTYVSEDYHEYIFYTDEVKSTPSYVVEEEKGYVDGDEVWNLKIYEISAEGMVSSTPAMKDSYYFVDSSGGVYLHIGSQDLDYLIATGAMAWGTLSGVISIALGVVATPMVGIAVVAGLGTLGIITVTAAYMFENPDGSMDLYFPPGFALNATLAIINPTPVTILMGVGGQTIPLVL